ncbi:probable cytochrome P450 9f2 [Phlebotomus papatasi]|uniref:probable cytochrome P450 9f2 n=1 Tax=Phlebotomus papatasi TaxID=29031 RepID=UPI00248394FA|nr:probable cytochrome P450 9f2 [Phlebotomus papatasi]XP_055696970.1 probable cytochrome P450 9f2 [Phlebotomus papatasi]
MLELLFIVAVVLLVKFIFDQGYKNEDFFKDKSIKFIKPHFMVGNSGNLFTRKRTIPEFFIDAYTAYPKEKFVGMFEFRNPMVLVKDPKTIKHLAVKEFDHFVDHRTIIPSEAEPLFGKSLILLKSEAWRDMRATLSPAFTGSKMRLMFELISDYSKRMVDFVSKETQSKGIQTYEMKDFFSRTANDIIATCAFGIQVNSLKDKDNEFFLKGREMTSFLKLSIFIKFILFMAVPKLLQVLRIRLIPESVTGFFKKVIIDAIDYREKNHIVRPDMIHLLMEAKKGKLSHQETERFDSEGFATVEESNIGKREPKKNLEEDDIAAQCFIFFFAGFDTVSTALSFLSYELAVNMEVQERLFQEVLETSRELGDKTLNYDTIQKMKYMDMVVSELLRMWPPVPIADRICTKELTYVDDDGLTYKFNKGDVFIMPVYAFHHDPEYFPNPSKFDPERFNEENKHNIDPGTYLPFGIGPRNCIGSRFALMELKALMYYILLNFKIEPNEKTQIPLKLTKNPTMLSEKGIWVQLTPRSNPA